MLWVIKTLSIALIILGFVYIIHPSKIIDSGFFFSEKWKPKAWKTENMKSWQKDLIAGMIRLGGVIVIIFGIWIFLFLKP